MDAVAVKNISSNQSGELDAWSRQKSCDINDMVPYKALARKRLVQVFSPTAGNNVRLSTRLP